MDRDGGGNHPRCARLNAGAHHRRRRRRRVCRAIARNLSRSGYDVTTCGSAAEARATIVSASPDVVALDYNLPDADGLQLLDDLRPLAPGAEFLMATAYPDLDVAVEAMRRGAADYMAKGPDARECLMRIERAA